MNEFAVEMHEVTKIFPTPDGGEVAAVNQVTLHIRHGEFFSLLGPSGCGKTTSLFVVSNMVITNLSALESGNRKVSWLWWVWA